MKRKLTKPEWIIYIFSGLLIFGLMRYIPNAISTSISVISADTHKILLDNPEIIKDKGAFVSAIWIERIGLPIVSLLAAISIVTYFFRSHLFPNTIIATYTAILLIVSVDHGMTQIWKGNSFFYGYIESRDVLRSLITTFLWGPLFLIPFVRKTFTKTNKIKKNLNNKECPAN